VQSAVNTQPVDANTRGEHTLTNSCARSTSSGVAFIPVLVLPDQTTVLQDSHAIIRHLEAQLQAPQPLLPATPRRALAAQLLELYADEWLLLPAMHYRWSFPEQRERLLYQFGR
jgi:glutathione S-transferase